ncbi:hypothetical protein [Embleya scabrispora]|uniref:hypothetical protein n=1 Tax=Embleya scabrispora TaxID=159449 RepID=UPI00036E8082|nr:hypothetical protein [Embleya scabrispora]MYS80774.1 hypothetical protein [Streptomyces sp. SID5474]
MTESIHSASDFETPAGIAEITAGAESDASPPANALTLQQLRDGSSPTRPPELVAHQFEGAGWMYSRVVKLQSFYYYSAKPEPFLDEWTSRSDKPGEVCDGGYIDRSYAQYDEGRWVFAFRANGTPPPPFTHSCRLASLRDGRMEYKVNGPAGDTLFPTDDFGRRGDLEMDVVEVVPKVIAIGARRSLQAHGTISTLIRYGDLVAFRPPERYAYIKWDGMAAFGGPDGNTTRVDCLWCVVPA